jgi:hypothetical protein
MKTPGAWDTQTLTTPLDMYYAPNMLVHGIVRSDKHGDIIATGKRDWTDPDSPALDGDTMFPEASVGKVRYAGLLYMLQQQGIIDAGKNALDFFSTQAMKHYLDDKYPGLDMQRTIQSFFAKEDCHRARLVDFTTHSAGVGDLRMLEISRGGKGMAGDYTLADVLKITNPPYTKPPARGPMVGEGADRHFRFDEGKYGVYQYSNIGYMLLAEAMEAAYFFDTGTHKTYKQLLSDFMLQPTEGYAIGKGLSSPHTKFHTDITAKDPVCITHWRDGSGEITRSNPFNGHLGAVGPFCSYHDAIQFFTAYFRGFPGTPQYGQGLNPFFTDATITDIRREMFKHKLDPSQVEKSKLFPDYIKFDPMTQDHYVGPGFMVETKKGTQAITAYYKSGVMFGCHSFMEFRPETGKVNIIYRATENISPTVATEAGTTVQTLMKAYTATDQPYDRARMLQEYREGGISAARTRIAPLLPPTVITAEAGAEAAAEAGRVVPRT